MRHLALLLLIPTALFSQTGIPNQASQGVSTNAVHAPESGTRRELMNTDIVKLSKSGIADDTILLLIKQGPVRFDTSPEALVQLKTDGVSDPVIAAMVTAMSPALPSEPATALQEGKKTPIPTGVTLCVASMTGNFDGYLIGEMQKQRVPTAIIASDAAHGCDPKKSFYTMTGSVEPEGKSFSARSIFGLRLHYRDEVQAAVKLVRNSDSFIVWAGDSDRGEVKKVAEHIVNQMLKQRPSWLPMPLNR